MLPNLEYDIVELTLSGASRKKRNIITVILFFSFLGLSAIGLIVFERKLLTLIIAVPFALVSYFVSRKSKELSTIGNIQLFPDSIHLSNHINGASRTLQYPEITKIFIRGGVELNNDVINKRSLFLDITLQTGEEITVHIAVKQLDEYTADQITAWCQALGIVCYRKL